TKNSPATGILQTARQRVEYILARSSYFISIRSRIHLQNSTDPLNRTSTSTSISCPASKSRRHDPAPCPNASLPPGPDQHDSSRLTRMRQTENPLLAQVPLTVSPFITLPKAPTLPHNYASLPSTLPPSILNSDTDDPSAPPAYVTSGTGFRAHPSTIIAQNKALREQLNTGALEARTKVRDWRAAIDERELAEKRRKAPGWLDSDAKILRPATTAPLPDTKPGASLLDAEDNNTDALRPQESRNDMGSQMDRAFG
ncbi:unnamed protein product, partial [Aureobasidium vineae]